jgi:hypothetical protein
MRRIYSRPNPEPPVKWAVIRVYRLRLILLTIHRCALSLERRQLATEHEPPVDTAPPTYSFSHCNTQSSEKETQK